MNEKWGDYTEGPKKRQRRKGPNHLFSDSLIACAHADAID